jgi:cyclase
VLKKRIVFTLLFDGGWFALSRNFRLQRVGNLEWLQKNYDFSHISFFIDELVVLDVTRGERNHVAFEQTLQSLAKGCFVPIAAGGGVRSVEHARRLLRSGADKIVLNTLLFESPEEVDRLAMEFGQQCVVASLDARFSAGEYQVYTSNGDAAVGLSLTAALDKVSNSRAGELYLNSIDRDGTGQGYDLALLDRLPSDFELPVILAGGVGNARHLAEGFDDPRVNAVATAHLFNFVGDGLKRARHSLLAKGAELACWADPELNCRDFPPTRQ